MTDDRGDVAALAPGGTIGILGGGQLGRMMALAAARLGLNSHIYCPDPDSPAFAVTPHRTVAGYDDRDALDRFAAAVDVVTYEFENVPAETAAHLARRRPLYPDAGALAVAQDRFNEKTFFAGHDIATVPFRPVAAAADIAAGLDLLGSPAILKTRRFGYDGKGQVRVAGADGADAAWKAVGGVPCILEQRIDFAAEVSLIAARGRTGETAVYDLVENRHQDHILRRSSVPARVDARCSAQARSVADILLRALDYVGILSIEFFVVGSGSAATLLVNEIAPRVHNSGHWTEAACPTCQFEQHVRAVCGWPLGSTRRFADVEMENILGAEAEDWQAIAGRPDTVLQLYGKTETRPGRKMGHRTTIRPRRMDTTW